MHAGFIPFGETNNDTMVTRADDSSFGPIMIDTPVVFFQRMETSYFVSGSHKTVNPFIFDMHLWHPKQWLLQSILSFYEGACMAIRELIYNNSMNQ